MSECVLGVGVGGGGGCDISVLDKWAAQLVLTGSTFVSTLEP